MSKKEETQDMQTTENTTPKTDAEILAELEKDAKEIIPDVDMPAPLPKTKKPVDKATKDVTASTKLKLKDIQLSTMWNRDKLGDISGLVQSIKTEGQLVPMVVRVREDGKFELVDGRRRHAALTEAGIPEALVTFSDCKDPIEAFRKSMAANMARADNTPLELSRSFAILREAGQKIKEIAAAAGCKESRISQYLKLEILPEEARKLLAQEKIDFSAARALCMLSYDDPRDLKYFDKLVNLAKEGKVASQTIEGGILAYLERKNAADKDKGDAKKKKGGKKSKSAAKQYDYMEASYVKSMKPLKPIEAAEYLNKMQEKRAVVRSPKQKAFLDGVQEGILYAYGMIEKG